jgi:hypothetical protein
MNMNIIETVKALKPQHLLILKPIVYYGSSGMSAGRLNVGDVVKGVPVSWDHDDDGNCGRWLVLRDGIEFSVFREEVLPC